MLLEEFLTSPPPKDEYSEVKTIYLGGGTPSMLTGRQVSSILETISRHLPIADTAEITLEANPGALDRQRLHAFKEAGVNRISFGLQSFDDGKLQFLGRFHDASANVPAVKKAREAGFGNVSVDLIYHLPGQTVAQLEDDLRKMIALNAEHVSIYSLTVESGTPLYKAVQEGSVQMSPDSRSAEMFRRICNRLAGAGYRHYEVSNFGKAGCESRHNQGYWNGRHYYSYGPSAHSYDGGSRWWNVRDLGEYFRRMQAGESPVEEREYLDAGDQRQEYLLTRLRTASGVNRREWEQMFNEEFPRKLEEYFESLERENPNWIETHSDGWRLTEEGWLFTDTVIDDSTEAIVQPEQSMP